MKEFKHFLINPLFEDFGVFLILSLVECNDFCEEFQRNGYKIDYGYQHNDRSDEQESLETPKNAPYRLLIIGHKYWNIRDVFSVNSTERFIPIEGFVLDTHSETSEWFGKEYKFALCHPYSVAFKTGLIRVLFVALRFMFQIRYFAYFRKMTVVSNGEYLKPPVKRSLREFIEIFLLCPCLLLN